jgi:uncharacterized membrane protein YdjX (TVP38/TMEM64 family)
MNRQGNRFLSVLTLIEKKHSAHEKLLIVLLALAFFALDPNRYLTLDGLKGGLAEFAALRADSPGGVATAFFAAYVVATALSLPGAMILTLGAGALIGFSLGTLIVSFASSLGVTLTFLASRFVLRNDI